MEYLFSYGTLQTEKVQLESFGRLLKGEPDFLQGYQLQSLEIKDAAVLAASGQQFHPIAVHTGNADDQLAGVVFEITVDELLAADQYEVSDYRRVSALMRSGKQAWVYIA